MSTDRDVTRIVRSWLKEDAHEDADRLLALVLDQVDTTPQRRAGWLARRFPLMNNTVKIALAAAVVVVLAVIGIGVLLPKANVGGPTPTATATPTPSPAPLPASGQLEPGSYEMSNSHFTPVRFAFTVPAGWATNSDGFVIKHADEPGELAFTAFIITHVFSNGCHWTGTSTTVGPTVDELANALAGQAERETSGPIDVTFAGYPAKRIELAASPDFAIATCDSQFIRTWPDMGGNEGGGWGARDGQSDSVYILDVNGKRVVIGTWRFPGATEADITEMEGIIASIHFEP